MKKEDFDYLERTLRELSLFIAELKAQEPWYIEDKKKASLRSLFYLVGGKNDPNVSPAPAPMRQSVVSQLNIKDKAKPLSKKDGDFIELNIPGVCVSNSPRKDGRYQGYILKNGKRFFFYGKNVCEVKQKICTCIKNGGPKNKTVNVNGIPTGFKTFTLFYFEKFRKKKVAQKTYEGDLSRLKNHIFSVWNNKSIKSITPCDVQDVLDRLTQQGKSKTALELYFLLNVIFKGAISHGILNKNPLSIVYLEKYEKKHGCALTSEELAEFKKKIAGSYCEQAFYILLYTGLRPNELASVKIDGAFIVARNSKRKNKKVEFKKIPINPVLKPFLDKPLTLSSPDYLRRIFKTIMPNHILYDLRTTFYSKCVESGVLLPALNHFIGHSSGVLAETYTTLSDEYLLAEGEKIRF